LLVENEAIKKCLSRNYFCRWLISAESSQIFSLILSAPNFHCFPCHGDGEVGKLEEVGPIYFQQVSSSIPHQGFPSATKLPPPTSFQALTSNEADIYMSIGECCSRSSANVSTLSVLVAEAPRLQHCAFMLNKSSLFR